MSDFDDLEEISEQSRYGYGNRTSAISASARALGQQSRQRGAKANSSLDKQQYRSSDRRRVLVRIENRE
jgi:hypothetical protein